LMDDHVCRTFRLDCDSKSLARTARIRALLATAHDSIPYTISIVANP
jgi:hypothetical protein